MSSTLVKFKIGEDLHRGKKISIHCQVRIVAKGSILQGGHGDYHTKKNFVVDLWQTVPGVKILIGLMVTFPNMLRFNHRPIFEFDTMEEIKDLINEVRSKIGTPKNRLLIVTDELDIFPKSA